MLPAAAAETTTDWIIAAGTIVAAVGTVAAVSLSLWQSSRQRKADLRVKSVRIIERRGGGHLARELLRLVGTNHGPQSIRIVDASLQFQSATGAMIGNMTAGGDELPKVVSVGETVTAEWDFEAVELARIESNGEPYTHLAFIDAFDGEHAVPYPGMKLARRWPRFRREYLPMKSPAAPNP